MVLSRSPLGSARVVAFRAGPPIERVFSQRALLDCTLTLPGVGGCRIVNVHLTAGGVRADGMSARVEAYRRRQIDQLLAHAAAGSGPVLIVGDLNAGPEASAANFRQLLEGGFSDAFVEAGEAGYGITWDPGNSLNAGYAPSPPPQRIDHVLVRADDPTPFRVTEAAVVLREPIVALEGRAPVSVSDHYGLMARIERN
jgi:endonuclease/exonuclease/phosphatase family metal-dependent hydrolase